MSGYHRVKSEADETNSQHEDCESLASSATYVVQPRPALSSLQLVFLTVAFPLTALLGAYFGGPLFAAAPITKVSRYSPLQRDVQIEFHTQEFNGSLFKNNVFRQRAGREVDDAWSSLGIDFRAAIIPDELAPKAGLLPSQVRIQKKYGGGYPANVEGFHHLHCLNLVRQGLWYNFDYYHKKKEGAFKNDDYVLEAHVSHCLDIIRQQLMCTVDVTVLGQVWWNKEKPTAYPDFNTKHTCRNFDAIKNWAEKHQAPLNVPSDYLILPKVEDVLPELP